MTPSSFRRRGEWRAGPDTRLEPDEVPTTEFDVPKKVVAVRASLAYHRVPGKVAKVLGVIGPQ